MKFALEDLVGKARPARRKKSFGLVGVDWVGGASKVILMWVGDERWEHAKGEENPIGRMKWLGLGIFVEEVLPFEL